MQREIIKKNTRKKKTGNHSKRYFHKNVVCVCVCVFVKKTTVVRFCSYKKKANLVTNRLALLLRNFLKFFWNSKKKQKKKLFFCYCCCFSSKIFDKLLWVAIYLWHYHMVYVVKRSGSVSSSVGSFANIFHFSSCHYKLTPNLVVLQTNLKTPIFFFAFFLTA